MINIDDDFLDRKSKRLSYLSLNSNLSNSRLKLNSSQSSLLDIEVNEQQKLLIARHLSDVKVQEGKI